MLSDNDPQGTRERRAAGLDRTRLRTAWIAGETAAAAGAHEAAATATGCRSDKDRGCAHRDSAGCRGPDRWRVARTGVQPRPRRRAQAWLVHAPGQTRWLRVVSRGVLHRRQDRNICDPARADQALISSS